MLGLRQADARPQALTAWDAWDGARRDATADAVRRLVRSDRWQADDAEKLAGRVRDARERRASRHRWELRAALEAEFEALAALELCTPAADRFAARSCAALAVVERPAWQRLAARQLVWKLQRVQLQSEQLARPTQAAQQEPAVARKQVPIQPAMTQAALLLEPGDTPAAWAPEALRFSALVARSPGGLPPDAALRADFQLEQVQPAHLPWLQAAVWGAAQPEEEQRPLPSAA